VVASLFGGCNRQAVWAVLSALHDKIFPIAKVESDPLLPLGTPGKSLVAIEDIASAGGAPSMLRSVLSTAVLSTAL
jgi:hypothetical protein